MASPTHILAVVLIASGALGARKTYEKGLTTAQMRLESAHEGLGVIDAARRCALIGDVGSTKTDLSLSCTDSSKRLKFMGSCTRANRSSFSEILNAGDLCFKASTMFNLCEADLVDDTTHLSKKMHSLYFIGSGFSQWKTFLQQVPAYFIATAGMRIWANSHDAKGLSVEEKLKSSLEKCYGKPGLKTSFMISSGLLEAYMGFITIPEQQRDLDPSDRVNDTTRTAYVEIGGSSLQVALACPSETGRETLHSKMVLVETQGFVRTPVIQAIGEHQGSIEIFGKSILGGGVNRVMLRVLKNVVNGNGEATTSCLKDGISITLNATSDCIQIKKNGQWLSNANTWVSKPMNLDNSICRHVSALKQPLIVSGSQDSRGKLQKCLAEVNRVFMGNDELRSPVPLSKSFSHIREMAARCSTDGYEKLTTVVKTGPISKSSMGSSRYHTVNDFSEALSHLADEPVESQYDLATVVTGAIALSIITSTKLSNDVTVGSGAEWSLAAAKLHLAINPEVSSSFFKELGYQINSDKLDPEDDLVVYERRLREDFINP